MQLDGMFWSNHMDHPGVELYDHKIWQSAQLFREPVSAIHPGDHLAAMVTLRNLTFHTITNPTIEISTDDPYVDLYPARRRSSFRSIHKIGPGELLGSYFYFLVSPDAQPGHTLMFGLKVNAITETWVDTLQVKVDGYTARSSSEPEIFAFSPRNVSVGSSGRMEIALPAGPQIRVKSVTASIRTSDGERVDEIVLQRKKSLDTREIFGGAWSPPFPADFYVQAEVEDFYGYRSTIRHLEGFSSVPFRKSAELLLVTYTRPGSNSSIANAREVWGLGYDLWNPFYRGPIDSSVVSQYPDVIVWDSWKLVPSSEELLISHLTSGGQLLIGSYGISSPEDVLATYLGIERIRANEPLNVGEGMAGDPITDGMTLHGEPTYGYALSSLQPETVPILRDVNGHIVGMRVEKEGYKAVYFSVPLRNLGTEAEVEELIARAIRWLRAPSTSVLFEEAIQPIRFALYPNHPNPFNARTTIHYEVPVEGQITLCVYSISGQKIRILTSGSHKAGSYTVIWDGTDEEGKTVGSGVYLYRLIAEGFRATRKMVLIH